MTAKLHDYSVQLLNDYVGSSLPARYLAQYLRERASRTIIEESDYIDRHYLADYQGYYSLSFRAPLTHCKRIHFFETTRSETDRLISRVYLGDDDSRIRLEESYLGFCVVRPLERAKVGRTVVRTYPDDGHRRFEVVRRYRVWIGGVELRVNGLAYQEQDQGAAVCASTALWSALQRVAYISGNRTPTPTAVTEAAGSPLPASYGLSDLQMQQALNALGYSVDQFEPKDNRSLFRARLIASLESQLPVVLLLSRKQPTGTGETEVGHAVTVTGFRVSTHPVPVTLGPGVNPILLRSGSVKILYVHDDNVGSHVHYELIDSSDENDEGHPILRLFRGDSSIASDEDLSPRDDWDVQSALVPKERKMRLPIDELVGSLAQIRPALEAVFSPLTLNYRVRSMSGVAFKQRLYHHSRSAVALREFSESVSLPRHVGVVTAMFADQTFCDLVLDLTDVNRPAEVPIAVAGRGISPNSVVGQNLNLLGSTFACPVLYEP